MSSTCFVLFDSLEKKKKNSDVYVLRLFLLSPSSNRSCSSSQREQTSELRDFIVYLLLVVQYGVGSDLKIQI